MRSVILGISCFFHDSAACLVRDGEIVAAAQEERFSRKKNDSSFPRLAINYCLEEARTEEAEISAVAFYENIHLVLDRIGDEMSGQPRPIARRMFRNLWRGWRRERADLDDTIRHHLPDFRGRCHGVWHHQAHAAAAFFPSPFDTACVLTIDGVGEWASATISLGDQRKIELLQEMPYPDSLGLFYSAATYFLGFKINSGEYKVMGLAPYGTPRYVHQLRDNIIEIHDDGSVALNPAFFNLTGLAPMATPAWEAALGVARRDPEAWLEQVHMDIAASVQKITELSMVRMARHGKALTGSRDLCLGGGVALNCVGNGLILREGLFDRIWIQPAAGDAGNALGAALALWNSKCGEAYPPKGGTDLMKGARLGPAYSATEITDFLEMYGFPFHVLDESQIAATIVDMILDGRVIGLFDGRMEFGPRALGSRSIIADARDPKMQTLVNLKVKFRESFRPFAPCVREEDAAEWFELDCPSRYMLLVAPVRPEKRMASAADEKDLAIESPSLNERLARPRSEISAVTHVDYSARVQTVPQEPRTRLRAILDEFFIRTGVPVLINTSFNLRSEPIVATPVHAYRCMMRSNIDAVLLENILVIREEQPEWPGADDWRKRFEPD